MTYDPRKFNPADVSTFPTADKVRPYELEVGIGGAIKIKSDSAEDHARAMEAIGMLKTMPQQALAPIQQPQYMEPQPEHTITLSKALESWSMTLANKDTRKNWKSFVNRFIAFNGDVEVHKVRGADVTEWKADLLKTLAPVTVDVRIQSLQSMLTWCLKHNYLSELKPLATNGKFAMNKGEREEQTHGAEAFSIEELNIIFEPVAYTKYTLKKKRVSLARHWMPLIGLFTGMRLEEIAQLQKNDIKTEGQVDYFDVNRDGGKKVKNKASIRPIPIHPTLIKMGFMAYVQGLKSGALFPELTLTENGWGNAVSKAFIRHLEKVGVRKHSKDRAKVFHSLRDTFNNGLERVSEVTREVRYTLMGHAQGGANPTNYTTPKELERLKNEGVDLLRFVETKGGVTHKLIL